MKIKYSLLFSLLFVVGAEAKTKFLKDKEVLVEGQIYSELRDLISKVVADPSLFAMASVDAELSDIDMPENLDPLDELKFQAQYGDLLEGKKVISRIKVKLSMEDQIPAQKRLLLVDLIRKHLGRYPLEIYPEVIPFNSKSDVSKASTETLKSHLSAVENVEAKKVNSSLTREAKQSELTHAKALELKVQPSKADHTRHKISNHNESNTSETMFSSILKVGGWFDFLLMSLLLSSTCLLCIRIYKEFELSKRNLLVEFKNFAGERFKKFKSSFHFHITLPNISMQRHAQIEYRVDDLKLEDVEAHLAELPQVFTRMSLRVKAQIEEGIGRPDQVFKFYLMERPELFKKQYQKNVKLYRSAIQMLLPQLNSQEWRQLRSLLGAGFFESYSASAHSDKMQAFNALYNFLYNLILEEKRIYEKEHSS